MEDPRGDRAHTHTQKRGQETGEGAEIWDGRRKNSGDIEMFVDLGSQGQNGKELLSTFNL